MSRTVPAMLTALVLTLPAMAADNACPLDHTIYEEPFSKTRYVIDEVRFQPGAADAVLVGRMTAHDGSRSSAPIALEIVLANGLVKSGWKEGDGEMVALLESRAPAPQEAMPAWTATRTLQPVQHRSHAAAPTRRATSNLRSAPAVSEPPPGCLPVRNPSCCSREKYP